MSEPSREFRDALGSFPTGVAIVTTTGPAGERFGATVSSFNSVSLAPPLVLFSIARTARGFAAWETAEHWAVNVLGEDACDMSTRFARPMSDKWAGTRVRDGSLGSPLLEDALAWFECRAHARLDGGDHLILVGEVKSFSVSQAGNGRPLVFHRGRYRRLDADTVIDTPAGLDHFVHGW